MLYVQRAGADPCVEVCFTSPSLVVLTWIVRVVLGARYAQNTEERRADSTRNTEHTSRSAAFTSPPGRSTTGSSARISTLPNRTLPERAFMVHLHRVTSGHGRRRRRSSGVRKDIGLRRQYNQSYRSCFDASSAFDPSPVNTIYDLFDFLSHRKQLALCLLMSRCKKNHRRFVAASAYLYPIQFSRGSCLRTFLHICHRTYFSCDLSHRSSPVRPTAPMGCCCCGRRLPPPP